MKGIKTYQGSETILFVEDEESLSELMGLRLEEKGYTILMARDGEEAIDMYGKHKNEIAVIIMDMGLPKLGGWEVLRRVRQIDPGARVILASAYVDKELKAEMITSGAKDYVQKPYDAEQIARKIREMIDAG